MDDLISTLLRNGVDVYGLQKEFGDFSNPIRFSHPTLQVPALHTDPSFHSCSFDCDCVVCADDDLVSLSDSEVREEFGVAECSCPPAAGNFTYYTTDTRIFCACTCLRCQFNVRFSGCYGIALRCGFSRFSVPKDDPSYATGTDELDPYTEILPFEQLLVECAMVFGNLSGQDMKIRFSSLRRCMYMVHNLLKRLRVYAPKIDSTMNIMCLTCGMPDDEDRYGCDCRRVYLTPFDYIPLCKCGETLCECFPSEVDLGYLWTELYVRFTLDIRDYVGSVHRGTFLVVGRLNGFETFTDFEHELLCFGLFAQPRPPDRSSPEISFSGDTEG